MLAAVLKKMLFFVSAIVYISTYNVGQIREYGSLEQILPLVSCESQKESGMTLKIYQF